MSELQQQICKGVGVVMVVWVYMAQLIQMNGSVLEHLHFEAILQSEIWRKEFWEGQGDT